MTAAVDFVRARPIDDEVRRMLAADVVPGSVEAKCDRCRQAVVLAPASIAQVAQGAAIFCVVCAAPFVAVGEKVAVPGQQREARRLRRARR